MVPAVPIQVSALSYARDGEARAGGRPPGIVFTLSFRRIFFHWSVPQKGAMPWPSQRSPSGWACSPCSLAWSPRATSSKSIGSRYRAVPDRIRHRGCAGVSRLRHAPARTVLTSRFEDSRRLSWDLTLRGCTRSGRLACRSRYPSRSGGRCSARSIRPPTAWAGDSTPCRCSSAVCSVAASRRKWTGNGTPSPSWRLTSPCSS